MLNKKRRSNKNSLVNILVPFGYLLSIIETMLIIREVRMNRRLYNPYK
jgi:hypothetical protein